MSTRRFARLAQRRLQPPIPHSPGMTQVTIAPDFHNFGYFLKRNSNYLGVSRPMLKIN